MAELNRAESRIFNINSLYFKANFETAFYSLCTFIPQTSYNGCCVGDQLCTVLKVLLAAVFFTTSIRCISRIWNLFLSIFNTVINLTSTV